MYKLQWYSVSKLPYKCTRQFEVCLQVELPLNITKANRGDILIEERCNVDPEVVGSHSLCTGLELQALDGIQGLERSEGNGIGEAKEINDGNSLNFNLISTTPTRCL